jgi:hypothetical protein
MYTSSVGSAARIAPAIGRFQRTASPPASCASATVIGWFAWLVSVTANRNSFQICVNCQMMTTTKPGSDSGKTMRP